MEKSIRTTNKFVFVSTFVPERNLPNKQPAALDPFLEPLVMELEDLFLNGKFYLLFKFFLFYNLIPKHYVY